MSSVRKDPDGAYDVVDTEAGGGGHGGGRGSSHTPVIEDEAVKVTAAVTSNDSGVAVTEVTTNADGSYNVTGTKAGAQIRLEVSGDLRSITAAGKARSSVRWAPTA